MTDLPEPPHLVWPTTAVRDSYLSGERIDLQERGTPTGGLDEGEADFDAYVEKRRGVHTRWGVPSTIFWYVSGEHYIGTLVIRHRLTPELEDAGGHIGYHVVKPWQRQGHATRMLAAGLVECRRLGIEKALLTCEIDNEPSRRVILANGGVPDGTRQGEDRFWIGL